MARAEVEAVPPGIHPWPRPRYARARDAPHDWERDRPLASDQETRCRRNPDFRCERDEPGRRLPHQRSEGRRRGEVRDEALERRPIHLLLRRAGGGQAPTPGPMAPRGPEPAPPTGPRGLRAAEPRPALQPTT